MKQAASAYNSLIVSLVIIITYLDKDTYTYAGVCMQKYIHTTSESISFVCVCVYGFRTDYLALDNQ